MIREAAAADCQDILRLVRELAEYEREPDAVQATVEDLEAVLFSEHPAAFAALAEKDGRVVGFALWFLTFSTWTGRPSLYLEDIFVEPQHRGGGHGRRLFSHLAIWAQKAGCARMDWAVLDWNAPAQGFYRAMGARPMDEWTTWRVDGPALSALARTDS